MLPVEVLVVLAFAAYRATRVVTADSISEPARAVLYRWAFVEVPRQEEPAPRAAWRTWVYELVTCPLCLGMWASGVVYLWWQQWGSARWVLVVLAVAGVQAVLAQRGDA